MMDPKKHEHLCVSEINSENPTAEFLYWTPFLATTMDRKHIKCDSGWARMRPYRARASKSPSFRLWMGGKRYGNVHFIDSTHQDLCRSLNSRTIGIVESM